MGRNAYAWAGLPIGLLLLTALPHTHVAQAAGIGWDKQGGAFQSCLDAEAKSWLDARVELVANDDPASGNVDDAGVAAWAADALKRCASKAGGAADPASEQQFMRYMAHWREHIYKAADEIRRKGGGPD